jgi:alpha-tubulin suppressor-like RCC1 family protein
MQFRTVGGLFLVTAGLMMPATTHAQTIGAGYNFTIALEPGGTVLTWGDNAYGQLGQGNTVDRFTPTGGPSLTNVIAVAAGELNGYALRSDGTVWAWGSAFRNGDGTGFQRNSPVQVLIPAFVTKISAGATHALALDNTGTVWAWGSNASGQIGDGTNTVKTTPVSIPLFSPATEIAAGYAHSLVVKASGGAVWGSGYNWLGELGDGTTMNLRLTPVQMTGVSGAVEVAAGMNYSLVRFSNGDVWGTGHNGYGQLCSNVPNRSTAALIPVSDSIGISTVRSHTLIRVQNTTVELWACGSNTYGQLGDGTTVNPTPFSPKLLSVPDASAISAGPTHSAVKTDALGVVKFWTWGNNADGQLGDGTTTLSTVPLNVWP